MIESIGFLSVEVFETIHFADVVQDGVQGSHVSCTAVF